MSAVLTRPLFNTKNLMSIKFMYRIKVRYWWAARPIRQRPRSLDGSGAQANSVNPRQLPEGSYLEKVLAVMFEFVDRLVDVGQGLMLGLLDETAVDLGLPAHGQLLEGADIKVAIMEEGLEPGHVLHHEAAVLTDGVPAHGRLAGRHVA